MGQELGKYLGNRKASKRDKGSIESTNNYGSTNNMSSSNVHHHNNSTLNYDRKPIRAGAMDILGPQSMRNFDVRRESKTRGSQAAMNRSEFPTIPQDSRPIDRSIQSESMH